jgi:hypothetical protein
MREQQFTIELIRALSDKSVNLYYLDSGDA